MDNHPTHPPTVAQDPGVHEAALSSHPARPRLFDAHLHIIDPAHPLLANNGYLPDPFPVSDYRARTAALNVGGGAIVSGSFQGV